MNERNLLAEADQRALAYFDASGERRVFPDAAALATFDQPLPEHGRAAEQVLRELDEIGSPATVTSNGPRYFGFVIGATLPAAAAAERLVLAWDQCASSFDNSPVADRMEKVAGRWVCEALGLPTDSAVGFGTSATACTLACLSAARRTLLARQGWDFDNDGLIGAPEIRVVLSETAHIKVKKALHVLGFGMNRLHYAPVDEHGRIDPARLPALDERTLLILQAGEVNTGEFDRFAELIPAARAAGAWAHVDGAFGLWARASSSAHLAAGVELADSWTTDGHKWLTPPLRQRHGHLPRRRCPGRGDEQRRRLRHRQPRRAEESDPGVLPSRPRRGDLGGAGQPRPRRPARADRPAYPPGRRTG
jgi:glutamate/tyrosine decarboxylase-like PLP-dependent enzyme